MGEKGSNSPLSLKTYRSSFKDQICTSHLSHPFSYVPKTNFTKVLRLRVKHFYLKKKKKIRIIFNLLKQTVF